MAPLRTLISLLTIQSICLSIQASLLCSNLNERLNTQNFATKTGYFPASKNTQFDDLYEKTGKNCSVIKVWFMSRHGTRYPVGNSYRALKTLDTLVNDVQYNFIQKRGCLDDEDIFEYKRWIAPYEPRDKGQLHSTGAEEMYTMGEYWRDLFPSLFNIPYNKKNIKIEFTTRNRTGQSAYHFLRGMYGDDNVGTIRLPTPYSPNFKLRFYKSCQLWLNEVFRNPTTYIEQKKFEETPQYQATVHAISERLGFIKPLSQDQISAMYDECRYELAWWSTRENIWCKPFTKHDQEVMEFHQDLKYYYEDSYGTSMNEDMACETITDLLTHMESTAHKACLYFSHDKTLLHVLTTLGLFKPARPLRHDQFAKSKNRKFKTSLMAPFASNMAFVLFKCDNELKVVFFLQGHPIILDSVCSELFCDWEQVRRFLAPIRDTCDLSKTCMMHDEL